VTDELASASVAEISVTPAPVIHERTRAGPAVHPHLRDVFKAVALEHGACIRPVQLRKINVDTGEVEQVMINAVRRWPASARHVLSVPRCYVLRSAGRDGTSRMNPPRIGARQMPTRDG
jgi:hypothetical protein